MAQWLRTWHGHCCGSGHYRFDPPPGNFSMPWVYQGKKKKGSPIVLVICLFTYLFILLFRAAPVGYGSSQVRGPIGATPTSLLQSHSNVGSELHL